jgi:bifunctional ADP-heptose synthase (sugar kinase/adenylyltransferase)
VFDVTGAGDTVIACFTLAWASGATPREAAIIANVAAGLVVAEVGAASIPWESLYKACMEDIGG